MTGNTKEEKSDEQQARTTRATKRPARKEDQDMP